MRLLLLLIVFLILLFNCEKQTEQKLNVINIKSFKVKESKAPFDSVAQFDTTIFYGKIVSEWRKREVHKPFVNLIKTNEGIITPSKTQMIDIYSCTDEFIAYTLGIGRVLKTKEKKLLPDSVIKIITKLYNEMYKKPTNNIYDEFVVFALAEAYKISVAYNPKLNGIVFLALIKTGGPEFKVIEKYEKIPKDNVYINIPLISGYYVLFFKAINDGYRIIDYGAAG